MRHRDPEKENLNHTRAALAMCENIDWNVGRLIKLLDQLSLARGHDRGVFLRQRPQWEPLEWRHEGAQGIHR